MTYSEKLFLSYFKEVFTHPLYLNELNNNFSDLKNHKREYIDILQSLYSKDKKRLYRCDIWKTVMETEETMGNDIDVLCYYLRFLRLYKLNDEVIKKNAIKLAKQNHLSHITDAIETISYDHNAHANYLTHQFNNNKSLKLTSDYAFFKDHRRKKHYKVSIIVSLYNAGDKLAFFLQSLIKDHMLKKHKAEIILIDSNSQSNELHVYNDFIQNNDIDSLYVKTNIRETIQTSWNRGINFSQGSYLVFLGVDEVLCENALAILSDTLDREDCDWAMGDSVITYVHEDGSFKKEGATFKRGNPSKEITYLNVTYLSYVGGMYKKDIHLKYGYYDGDFTCAGDTEFKKQDITLYKSKIYTKNFGKISSLPY